MSTAITNEGKQMKTIVKAITTACLAALSASAFAAQQLSPSQLDGITAGSGNFVMPTKTQPAGDPAPAPGPGPIASTQDHSGSGGHGSASGGLHFAYTDAGARASGGDGALAVAKTGQGVGNDGGGGYSKSVAGQVTQSRHHSSLSGTATGASGESSGGNTGAIIESQANASPYHTGGNAEAITFAYGDGSHGGGDTAHASAGGLSVLIVSGHGGGGHR
jgi:hypothetical protein